MAFQSSAAAVFVGWRKVGNVCPDSVSEVDYPYFQEVVKKTEAAWYIGYHSLDDMKRLMTFTGAMGLDKVTVFRT